MFDLIMIGNIKQFVFIYIACVAEADNDVSKVVGSGTKDAKRGYPTHLLSLVDYRTPNGHLNIV